MARTEDAVGVARNGRETSPPAPGSLPATVNWLRDQALLLETNVEVNPDLEQIAPALVGAVRGNVE